MNKLLEGKVKAKGSVISIYGDNKWVDIRLDETQLNTLQWMVTSTSETVFSKRLTEWELFFGPYINGTETGYIFQAINLYSREVTTAMIPFRGDVDVTAVKQALASLFCKGENDESEKEK